MLLVAGMYTVIYMQKFAERSLMEDFDYMWQKTFNGQNVGFNSLKRYLHGSAIKLDSCLSGSQALWYGAYQKDNQVYNKIQYNH